MSSPFVAILMGSKSDLEAMQAGAEILRNFGIRYEIKISSAHRTPEATRTSVEHAVERGCPVFVARARPAPPPA
ncbi:MAG: AIR carboxylase family protein, partial [Gammaproteobacteria bacterium]|nr:AIR carboxylase family protein [Gammaproteobacteria bacterium]